MIGYTMFTRHILSACTWIDAINPTATEVHDLMEEFSLPPEFVGDLTTRSPRADMVARTGGVRFTIHLPIVKRTDISHPHEVKFIVTKRCLLTVRYEDIEAFHRYGKEFEVQSTLSRNQGTLTGWLLFLSLAEYLYGALDRKLDYIETRIQEVEQAIFLEREKENVFLISHLARRMIMFQQVLGSHEIVLEELPQAASAAFGAKGVTSLDSLIDYHRALTHRAATFSRTLTELRETNFAMLTTKQNEIIKILTIMAFITFPLTLFTSMFGMNTATTPIIGQPGDFWIILSIMVVVSIAFFVYFYYKKWL